MRRNSGSRPLPRRNAGFTLFEVVLVMCLLVLLYQTAEQRMNDLPAAAERASFYGVLSQLKTGLNLAMLAAVTSGDYAEVRAMEGSNPMDNMLEVPGNYGGEVNGMGANLRRASWYFDASRGELVYLVGEANIENLRVSVNGSPASLGQVRLRVTSARGGDNSNSLVGGASGGGRFQGMLLVPVYPFEWQGMQLDIVAL